MASILTAAYYQDRIDNALLTIEALETAMVDLSTGTIKSYTLNTGQTTQSVTKKNINLLTSAIESCYGLIEFWDMRKNGGGPAMYVRGAC